MIDKHYRLIDGQFRATHGWQRPTSPSPHPLMAVAPGTVPGVVSIPNELRAPVLSQGQVGMCTCEALTELLTGIALRDGVSQSYSHKAPYWYARKLDGNSPTDDCGSTLATVMTVAQTFGVPHYDAWSDEKDFTLEPDTAAVLDASKRKSLLVFALPTVAAIKASIRDGFSCAIGFSCPDDLFSDQTLNSGDINFYADDEHYKGDGHAVSIVACDDSYAIGNCIGAFTINCHWGTSVGENGYFRLPYRFLTSGFGGDAHTLRLMESL